MISRTTESVLISDRPEYTSDPRLVEVRFDDRVVLEVLLGRGQDSISSSDFVFERAVALLNLTSRVKINFGLVMDRVFLLSLDARRLPCADNLLRSRLEDFRYLLGMALSTTQSVRATCAYYHHLGGIRIALPEEALLLARAEAAFAEEEVRRLRRALSR
jgi:hypothetical protein